MTQKDITICHGGAAGGLDADKLVESFRLVSPKTVVLDESHFPSAVVVPFYLDCPLANRLGMNSLNILRHTKCHDC